MKVLSLITILFTAQIACANALFPQFPDQNLTPGELCKSADSYRYPEQIAYCDRDVLPELKDDIIATYDEILDYRIQSLPRKAFKIDHYIPLCMGGSNSSANLWPQHKSLFKITDPLEEKLCDKMAEGLLLQSEAVEMIKRAKTNPQEVHQILKAVNSL